MCAADKYKKTADTYVRVCVCVHVAYQIPGGDFRLEPCGTGTNWETPPLAPTATVLMMMLIDGFAEWRSRRRCRVCVCAMIVQWEKQRARARVHWIIYDCCFSACRCRLSGEQQHSEHRSQRCCRARVRVRELASMCGLLRCSVVVCAYRSNWFRINVQNTALNSTIFGSCAWQIFIELPVGHWSDVSSVTSSRMLCGEFQTTIRRTKNEIAKCVEIRDMTRLFFWLMTNIGLTADCQGIGNI